MSAEAPGHRLVHEVVVAAPRPAVWRLVEDAEALKSWVPGLRSVTAPDGEPGGFGPGATFVQRVRIGLLASACHGTVTEFVSPSRLAVTVRHALFDLDIGYAFAPLGQKTRVVCEAGLRGQALGTVVPRAAVERVTAGLLEEHLASLQALAEGRAGR